MRFTEKIMIISILLFSVYCREKSGKDHSFLKKFDTKPVVGMWRVVPSMNSEVILFEPDGGVKVFQNSKEEKMYAYSDSRGMRLTRSENDPHSVGFFLFAEKNEGVWNGVMNEKVVRLVRIGEEKKSVLE